MILQQCLEQFRSTPRMGRDAYEQKLQKQIGESFETFKKVCMSQY